MKKDGPIFVVGAPRSGTTLLQRMLRSHPGISSPTGESHFFIPLLRDASNFGNLADPERLRALLAYMHGRWAEFLDTDFHGVKFDVNEMTAAIHLRGATQMPEVLDYLFRINAEGERKARWLDKTPYYVLHIPTLLATYPDAQFVHIIRDGRDTVMSMLDRAADLRIFNTDTGAHAWQRYVQAGRAAGRTLSSSQYFELHYEDILADPIPTVRALCDFLGEPFSDSVIDFQKSRDPHTKTPLLRKGLQKNNSEKWRSAMTARQIRTFESIAGETLLACGYDLAYPTRTQPWIEHIVHQVHQRLKARLVPHPRDRASDDKRS